jgi:hypothetical protein
MNESTFSALANEFASLRAQVAKLELENAELRVFSKLPTIAGVVAHYVSHEEADEVRDLQPEIVLPSGTYEIPTGPQQHARAVWRNREFSTYLASLGLKGKPVGFMLVADWFKRIWFGDVTHGVARLEEAGFTSVEDITVHHIVPQGLGGPDSVYNFHLVPLAVNSSFGLHFTKESVAWVGAENAHVACEVTKFVARRAVDKFDDRKFDPFAASCPTKAVKRKRARAAPAETPENSTVILEGNATGTFVTQLMQYTKTFRPNSNVELLILEGNATGTFVTQLMQYTKTFRPNSNVELLISPEGSIARGTSADGSDVEYVFSFGADLGEHTICCKASELFCNKSFAGVPVKGIERITGDRWPALSKALREKGLRLEVLEDSISVVSVHDEREWKKLTWREMRNREDAELGPSTSNVSDVLEAYQRQHGRIFESPPALVNPYSAAYKKATDKDPPSDSIFWKLAKGSECAVVSKDMAKVAYYAGQLAECEKRGCKADVLLFKCREANYVGMTKLGFECWMHMLKKARCMPLFPRLHYPDVS